MRRVGIAILAFAMLVIFYGCGAKTEDTADTVDSNSSVSKASDINHSGKKAVIIDQKNWKKVGKSVEFQNIVFTVNAFRTVKVEKPMVENGEIYYMLDMTAKNKGSEDGLISATMFRILDSEHEQHISSMYGAGILEKEDNLNELDHIVPGAGELRGGLAFKIPEDARGLKLIINDMMNEESETIELD